MKKQTIMIVDDEERFVMIITKIFERLGSLVLRASHGKEALELLEDNDVDVIFLDVNMPRSEERRVGEECRSRGWPDD